VSHVWTSDGESGPIDADLQRVVPKSRARRGPSAALLLSREVARQPQVEMSAGWRASTEHMTLGSALGAAEDVFGGRRLLVIG
jgi:hypothetical protein